MSKRPADNNGWIHRRPTKQVRMSQQHAHIITELIDSHWRKEVESLTELVKIQRRKLFLRDRVIHTQSFRIDAQQETIGNQNAEIVALQADINEWSTSHDILEQLLIRIYRENPEIRHRYGDYLTFNENELWGDSSTELESLGEEEDV